jgi:hypothetical protein
MSNHDAINNVRRKINEVMKKTDERIVVGWRPPTQDSYKEGDIWTDADDRKWTIKNGIRQTITKLDTAKTPWFCPACEKSMSHRLDTKYWTIRGKCMECVIKDETEMRRQGTWKEYEQSKVRANFIAFLKDKIQELTHLHETVSSPEIIHADDEKILMIEKWNVDIDKIKEDLMTDLTELKTMLEKVENGELDETE